LAGDLDLKAPMEFPEGKYNVKDTMLEISKNAEAMEVTAKAIKLATNFTIAPGEGMWDMMKSMTPEGMVEMNSAMMPEGFLESLNAQLIQIDKA
ncbi:MAG: beta-galactosidase, partial [Eubacteriales bacterium]|nr:beta-galactosidase [Eubacteriales bacterium]